MPGDVSAGTGPGPGARPELRTSHEDRDRAVEILRVAAGDGRLTAAELDKRVEAALTARTSGELAALTADLPDVSGQAGSGAAQAKDVVRLDYQGGNATRRGRWVVPARIEIRAVGGTVKLDFTDAVITQPTLQIQAYVRGGGLVLVTKPGIEVDADGITVRGGTVRIRPRNGWKEPVRLAVEIRARTGAGASPLAHRAGCSGNRCVGPDRTPGHSATDTLGTKTCCPDGQAAQTPHPRRLPSMRGLSSAGIDDDIGAERRISHFKRHAVPITARDGEMVALRPPIA